MMTTFMVGYLLRVTIVRNRPAGDSDMGVTRDHKKMSNAAQ
jgi:hypothetical protein